MTDDAHAAMLADLRRLIEAIDRRAPRLAHQGEPGIAREAAELRARAVRLIDALNASVEARPHSS